MAISQEFSVFSEVSGQAAKAREARHVARRAFTATLATIDHETGYPFATLVSVALSEAGDPLLLLSGLARHTKNIAAHSGISLLFESAVETTDPLASGRVTIQGDVAQTPSDTVRSRFLARHPEAAGYADFADFDFYHVHIQFGHYIAGFGRIVSFARAELCLDETLNDKDEAGADLSQLSQTYQDVLRVAWRDQVGGLAPASKEADAVLSILCHDRDGFDVRNGEAIQRLQFPGLRRSDATLDAALAEMITESKGH